VARLCKILVVEDNDSIREFLQILFDDEGYEIVVVTGGESMRAVLKQDRFDVALIDVTLPGADDGFTLAEVAKATGCGVILVTGDARNYEAVTASGHRYLFKPFRIEQLMRQVAEAIAEADISEPDRPRGEG
jgi:DNA-binding NtrC family response regulator